MAKEPNWSSQELAIVDHHVAALRQGKYASVRAAASACRRELARRGAPGRPGRRWTLPRTVQAVYLKLNARALASGATSYQKWWTPEELQAARRYARALAEGRIGELRVAAQECRQEISRLPRLKRGVPGQRTLRAVSIKVIPMARRLGWRACGMHIDPQEDRLINRFLRALVRGEYTDSVAAARACHAELLSLYRVRPALRPMTFSTVRTYIRRRYYQSGRPMLSPTWTVTEDKAVTRYARALVEGRYATGELAAQACAKELARLREGERGSDPDRHHKTRPRGIRGVTNRINAFARRLGQPRPYIDWTDKEKAILERHARGVIDGEHANAGAATRACFRELQGYFRRLRTTSHARSIAGRSQKALLGKMHQRVRELGRRGPPNRRWSADEKRFLAQWVRWYDRFRGVRRLRPLTEAALGLQADVERLGSTRTTHACKAQLQIERMRLLGFA